MQIDLAHTISGIVDSLLPQMKSDKVVSISFNYRFYGKVEGRESETIFSADVYFLFIRGGNYMKVVTWVDSDDLPKSEKKIWDLASYHDSCWRYDGFAIFDEIRRKSKLSFDQIGHVDAWLRGFNLLNANQVANVIYRKHDGGLRRFINDEYVPEAQ